jgi:hypothetical protein
MINLRIVDVLIEIRSWHFLNKTSRYYHLSKYAWYNEAVDDICKANYRQVQKKIYNKTDVNRH